VIDVLINDEGGTNTVKALLYRGTPDNPAFSNRALLDEVYAAAVMSVAVGPSGPNAHYLYSLDEFLKRVRENESQLVSSHEGDTLTGRLANLTKQLQNDYHVYFLYGSGSNQHDQLLLHMPTERFGNAAKLLKGDEAHELKEFLLIVPKVENEIPKVKNVYAGGGHSALLSNEGNFYLWGWNDSHQLGREEKYLHNLSFPVIPSLSLKVSDAALGHYHTLVIEKDTCHLYAFGDNRRGQVTGNKCDGDRISLPTKVDVGEVVQVAAGLFHSAVITKSGTLITFGCDRFGQTLKKRGNELFGRWETPDGSRLLKVRCGQKHTLALDEFGRIWSMGDNKYGQLGRKTIESGDGVMNLVEGELGQKHNKDCIDIDCGWSHCIALVPTDAGHNKLYGFGRNDFHQLGSYRGVSSILEPTMIHDTITDNGIKCLDVCCGSESTIVLDDAHELHAVGWNEHGNLGIGHSLNTSKLFPVQGSNISTPRGNIEVESEGGIIMSAGGAHFICALHLF
jgi:alpha-tubulin suppressor-like RCC1 family protein